VREGVETITALTDECGRQGDVWRTPLLATHTGDVAPTVILADQHCSRPHLQQQRRRRVQGMINGRFAILPRDLVTSRSRRFVRSGLISTWLSWWGAKCEVEGCSGRWWCRMAVDELALVGLQVIAD